MIPGRQRLLCVTCFWGDGRYPEILQSFLADMSRRVGGTVHFGFHPKKISLILLFWDNNVSTLNLGLSIAHNQALPLQNIVRVDSIRNFNDAF